jgi:polyisoprenoid-binding protein YceI
MNVSESRFRRSSAACAALLLALAGATGAARAEPATYRIDPVHTQVLFFASHLGFSKSMGRFPKVSGTFTFDEDDFAASKVEVTIDVTSLYLGDDAWEKKMRSTEFFAAEKFPTATFTSSSFDGRVLRGDLTLRGVTKPVELKVRVNRVGRHTFSFDYVAGFSATGTLKRSDFGMKRLLPAVADDVELRLEVEGIRE